jgi:hypothetical protein
MTTVTRASVAMGPPDTGGRQDVLLHQIRRLAVRWERRLDLHQGLLAPACVITCWRRLTHHQHRSIC